MRAPGAFHPQRPGNFHGFLGYPCSERALIKAVIKLDLVGGISNTCLSPLGATGMAEVDGVDRHRFSFVALW